MTSVYSPCTQLLNGVQLFIREFSTMKQSTKVDWLSFTVPCPPMHARSHEEMHDRVGEAQRAFAPNFDWDYLIAPDWETAKGRPPYRECLRSPLLGLSVYW